jgi:MFS family permease
VEQGPHYRHAELLQPISAQACSGVVIFANSFASLVIYPFLPFMIADFFPDVPNDQLGTSPQLHSSKLDSPREVFGTGDQQLLLGKHEWLTAGLLCIHVLLNTDIMQWGKLSDHFGRRPTMLAGIVGTFMTITAFGFRLGIRVASPRLDVHSHSYAFAVAIRYFWGLMNGNIGVAKSYLSEVRCRSVYVSLGQTDGWR